jgi:uncharacterized membrane protein YphA (DoxX/SURF4 family)
MTNPLKTQASTNLGLLLARLPMGAFFFLAGYDKVFHKGVDKFVELASSSARPLPFEVSHGLMNGYLHAIPFLEMIVGTWLVVGMLSRLSAFVGSLMLVSFIVGATGMQLTGAPFHPNLIYLGVTLCVLLAGPGNVSLDQLLFNRKKKKPAA